MHVLQRFDPCAGSQCFMMCEAPRSSPPLEEFRNFSALQVQLRQITFPRRTPLWQYAPQHAHATQSITFGPAVSLTPSTLKAYYCQPSFFVSCSYQMKCETTGPMSRVLILSRLDAQRMWSAASRGFANKGTSCGFNKTQLSSQHSWASPHAPL